MNTHRFPLFTLLGFTVAADLAWVVLSFAVAFSFAGWVFPNHYPDLSPAAAWAMGGLVALGLAASVLVHKLAHALMARYYGREQRGIGLFVVGDSFETAFDLGSPEAELATAAAGPAASLFLSGGLGLTWIWGASSGWPAAVTGPLAYLTAANLALGLVNLVPAFPLDGGRALVAVLWFFKRDLVSATEAATTLGSLAGTAVLVLGIVVQLSGSFSLGLALFLGGLLLRTAAQMSYRQVLLVRTLAGQPVSRFMKTDPVAVPRAISVAQLVEDFIYRHQHPLFPVVDGERLVGYVTPQHVKALPREEWERQTVGSIATRPSGDNTVAPDADALDALTRMSHGRTGLLMVADGERLVGVVQVKELLQFFSLKMSLEGARGAGG